MSAVEFMSAEHIARMNDLLHDDPAVREACAALDRERTVCYRLSDGPDGATVHWTISFGDSVRFSLDEVSAPDVCLVGDWAQVVRASAASRDGRRIDPDISVEGDLEVLAEVNPVFELARTVATVPVEFPNI